MAMTWWHYLGIVHLQGGGHIPLVQAHSIACGFSISAVCARNRSSIRLTNAKENTIADGEWLETPRLAIRNVVLNHKHHTNVMRAASERCQFMGTLVDC